MSVTANVIVRKQSPPLRFQGLPVGMQPFYAQGTVTGDGTGGNVDIQFLFNPNQDNTYVPYVSLCFASWRGTVVDPVTPPMLRLNLGEWDKSVDSVLGIRAMQQFVDTETTEFISGLHHTYYLGRIQPGQFGTLEFRSDQVDTCIYNAAISGFIAEYPFVADETWKV